MSIFILGWRLRDNEDFFTPHYLVNGESDQKSVTNKKDAKSNFLSGVCYQI